MDIESVTSLIGLWSLVLKPQVYILAAAIFVFWNQNGAELALLFPLPVIWIGMLIVANEKQPAAAAWVCFQPVTLFSPELHWL